MIPLLLLCAVGGATAELPSFRVVKYGSFDGLPQNKIKALCQTRDGYLWAGTLSGLARFDGTRFTVFDHANTPAMLHASDSCTALAEDRRDGSLWIGTNRGLIHRRGGTFVTFTEADGLGSSIVLSLAPSARGGVWVGTHSGLHRVANGQVEVIETTAEGVIHAVLEDRVGRIWLSKDDGLHLYDPESKAVRELVSYDISSLYEDGAGVVWANRLRSSQLVRCAEGKAEDFAVPGENAFLRVLGEYPPGRLWICAETNGIWLLEGGALRKLSSPTSGPVLPAERSNMVVDHEGGVWIGTHKDGLCQLQFSRFQTIRAGDTTRWNNVWSICEQAPGLMWLGTDAGVARVEAGRVRQLPFKGGRNVAGVGAVFVDTQQRIWAAKHGEGVCRVEGGQVVHFRDSSATGAKYVSAISEDGEGRLWFGGQGLWQLTESGLAPVSLGIEGDQPQVRALWHGADGAIWAGTYEGLRVVRNGNVTRYGTDHGLAHRQVYSIHGEAETGVVWVGTHGGLSRYKDGRFTSITRQHGLFANEVNAMLQDDGYLWIACLRGIFRVSLEELHAVADGRAGVVGCITYGESDGMPSSETNGERQPSAWKARDGTLWFCTQKGAVGINPKAVSMSEPPPRVVVESVRAEHGVLLGEGVPAAGAGQRVRVSPRQARSLEIAYTACSFVAPQRMQFRVRLDGYDDGWREVGTRRFAVYTNLRPGDYTFRVAACNSHGVWNEAGASFAFFVPRRFHQTVWFVAGCTGIVLMGFGLLHRLRMRHAKRREILKAEKTMAEQRARIAQDIHDDIGANLTNIALLNEVVQANMHDLDLTRRQSARIAAIADQTLEGLNELVWTTNPRYDSLENLVAFLREYIAGALDPAGIRFTLEFPASVSAAHVDPVFRRHILLVVKEVVQNILKHSGATEVHASLRLGREDLQLTIEDNGVGLPTEVRAGGAGLSGIKRRMGELQGRVAFVNPTGRGLRVHLVAPLRLLPQSTLV